MGNSVNRVVLVGFLGRDPEIKNTNNGNKIANLTIATSETWKDKQSGEKQEKTEWHRVVIFNQNLAEVAEKYLHKGSKVYVEGALQTRKWTDNDGQEKRITEIVLSAYNGNITLLDGKSASKSEPEKDTSNDEPDEKIPF